MAQKVNSNIFRLGIKKNEWKSKYFENTKEEFSLYTFQSLEIKNFLHKFLSINGLILHDYKLQYSDNTIYLFVSYYTTSKASFLINKISGQQNLKLSKNTFYNIKQKKEIEKQNIKLQNLFFPILKNTNNKNSKKIVQRNLIKKKILKYYENYLNYKSDLKKKLETIRKYEKILLKTKNIKQFKLNNFSEQLIESISMYTNKKFNIFTTFQNLNKGLSLNLTRIQTDFFKKKSLELRRESQNSFFKETINILVISIIRKNSAQLLAEFIAYQLNINKRHNFFLIFIKRFLNTLILKKKISNVSGIKFSIKGRFNGGLRANKRTYESGNVSIQTINSSINYHQATSYTRNGTFGIKVWICRK